MIIMAMAIIRTGIPLPMGTIMITTASQLTDMTTAIVIAEGLQSWRSSANWLERVIITVPLTELWGQKPVARCVSTNVRRTECPLITNPGRRFLRLVLTGGLAG